MLRYLASYPNYGLRYAPLDDDAKLVVHGDCSFAPNGKASHEGHCCFIGRSLVNWRSKRQTLVAMSSCEGELIAASQSLVMGRVLRLLFAELFGWSASDRDSFTIAVDNTAAIAQIQQGEHASWRSRHISIRGTAISSAVTAGEVSVIYVGTEDMAADGLTKALVNQVLQRMRLLWHVATV